MKQQPSEFIASLKNHFNSTIVERVLQAIPKAPTTSIRINKNKAIAPPANALPVPWSDLGFILQERPYFAHDPNFHAGAYYVQDSSSMILEEMLRELDISRDILGLDLCAAPGGKSTILLDYLAGEGFLIANEIDSKRNKILQENLLKWGHTNFAISQIRSEQFGSFEPLFDLILVDAPCSGEGMFRKDEYALTQWSEKLVAQCERTQEIILNDVIPSLKPGGILIYSTCTLNPKENELQLQKLIASGEMEIVTPLLTKHQSYLESIEVDGQILGHYLLPGISTGEGLFIAALQKVQSDDRIIAPRSKRSHLALHQFHDSLTDQFNLQVDPNLRFYHHFNEYWAVSNSHLIEAMPLKFKSIGLPFYEMKGKHCIPLHGLAMTESIEYGIQLNHEDALKYLRKETFSLPPETKTGWSIAKFGDRHLGWMKVLENRTNNYYPGWLRLRN